MKTIEGYDIKIFTDNIEEEALNQIKNLAELEPFRNKKFRFMSDAHAGAGCVIGTTVDLGDKVIPNIVGVDLGCGVRVINLGKIDNLSEETLHDFHNYINTFVPSGMTIRKDLTTFPKSMTNDCVEVYKEAKNILTNLYCYRDLKNVERLRMAIGSLGGGNHFIELDKDDDGNIYIVIHTGSRNLGKQVADIYQNKAIKHLTEGEDEFNQLIKDTIQKMKDEGRRSEIQATIAKMKKNHKVAEPKYSRDLCYVEGEEREQYLHDMRLCQDWAVLNRKLIGMILTNFFGVTPIEEFESIHNYIGDDNIIRKGAISAYEGEKCIIPMNMRDGSLICVGKGNEDWNFSAPHGAGRIMSRSKAFENISIDEFVQSMRGINTWSVNESTIDESPMAYKPMQEIIDNIGDTVEIVKIIKPIFNFKAS